MPPETPHCKDARRSSALLDSPPRERRPRGDLGAAARRRRGLRKVLQPRVEGAPQGGIHPVRRHRTRTLPAHARPHAAHQPRDRRGRRMEPGSAKRRADGSQPRSAVETGLGKGDPLPAPASTPRQRSVHPRQHPWICRPAEQVAGGGPAGQRHLRVGPFGVAEAVHVPRHGADAGRRHLPYIDVQLRPPQGPPGRRADALHRAPRELERRNPTQPHDAAHPQRRRDRPGKGPTKPLPKCCGRRSETNDRRGVKPSLNERDDHCPGATQGPGQPRLHRPRHARALGGPRAGRTLGHWATQAPGRNRFFARERNVPEGRGAEKEF